MKGFQIMKRLMFTASIFASLSLCAAGTVTDNFTKNTWSNWSAAKAKISYKLNPKEGIKNSGCLQLSFLPGNPNGKDGYFLKYFPVVVGKSYEASVMIRNVGAGNAKASISVQAMDAKNGYISSLATGIRKAGNDWMRISCRFKIPAKTANVRVLLGAVGNQTGYYLFDDFEMKEIKDAGIEFIDHCDTAHNWGFWKYAKSKSQLIFSETEGKEYPGSVGVKILQGNPAGTSGVILRQCPIVPGKEYTFKVWAKTTGLAPTEKISFHLQGQNAKGFTGTNSLGVDVKASEYRNWKQIVYTCKIPATGNWGKSTKVLVTLGVGGTVPGQVLFDDFEFLAGKK